MWYLRKRIDRRSFLKGAATAAGVTLIGTAGCDTQDPSSSPKGSDEETDGTGTGQPHDSDSGTGPEDTSSQSRQGTMLFSPASIGGVELKNRLIRSATEEAYMNLGRPTPKFTKIFTDLAAGGMGGIISGIAMVAKSDAVWFELHAYNDSFIEGFKRVRDAVREADPDCKVFAQVGHTGHRYHTGLRIGPSSKGWPGDMFPMRALDIDEIPPIVENFAQAIRRFQEGGWDGVEIHGGHGYLISSFLSPYTNERTDRYGGDVSGRAQIVREIMERSRELVGDDYPIFIKINCDDRGGTEPEDLEGGIDRPIFIETANELAKMKIDALDVSGNNCSQAGLAKPEEQSYFKEDAFALDLDIPIILTGGNRRADDLNDLLETYEVDFMGISRPLIREPDLANKWLSGERSSTECISCNKCTQMTNLIAGMRCHQPS